jgi:hypothetical protein
MDLFRQKQLNPIIQGAVDVVFDEGFFKTWYTSGPFGRSMVNLKFHITSNMQSQLMGSTG